MLLGSKHNRLPAGALVELTIACEDIGIVIEPFHFAIEGDTTGYRESVTQTARGHLHAIQFVADMGEIDCAVLTVVVAELFLVEESMHRQGSIEGSTTVTLAQKETIAIGIIDRLRRDAQFATI